MPHGFFKNSWRSMLPDVFAWLDQVKTIHTADSPAGVIHVVPVRTTDEASGSKLEVTAPALSDVVRRKLTESATAIGWKGGSGGQSLTIHVDGTPYILVAVVKHKGVTTMQKSRQLGLDAVKALKGMTYDNLAICRSADLNTLAVFDGVAAGFYDLKAFKSPSKSADSSKLPTKITFVADGGETADAKAIAEAREAAKAVTLTRMLQDAPANWLDPIRFAEIAADVAKDLGLKCSIKNKSEIEAMGMGSFVGVANGSPIEPRLITIEIEGKDNSKTVCLVGKGLTFDAGGISLKPSLGMGEMKYDMSGGAAVLGAAWHLAKVKPPTRVVCIIGATENMPSGSATKPGDVHVAMNGKTIEILNTDAEGRLVLADLLHYAVSQFNPSLTIDIATLTGAVLMALGHAGAGVMSNDQGSADFVLAASRRVGEPMWQLPLWPEMDKEVKGEFADLANIAKPNVAGGTIIGGVFLKEFVGDKPWAHLDIAGTAWSCKATGFPSSGGSAYGLRTMVESCLRFQT